MIKSKSSRMVLGAMNLFVVGSPLLAPPVTHAAKMDEQFERLNIASLKSIENSWLEVPAACKARAFNASPVSLEENQVSSHIQSIYSSFEV